MNLVTFLSSTDLSTASITTSAIGVNHVYGFSIQIVFTGSPVGVFKLQASNDEVEEYASVDANTWDDITGSEISVTTADAITWNHEDVFFRWVRVVWTKTSGTGTITKAIMNEKLKDFN